MKYEQVFKCYKCSEDYNESLRRPMIVCQYYHSICKACLNSICKEDNKIYGCPICRARMTKRQAYYNGSFFQYRKFVREVISIKQDFQDENKGLIRQLDRLQSDYSQYRQKNKKIEEQVQKLKKMIKQHKINEIQLDKQIKALDQQNVKLKNQLSANSLKYVNQIAILNNKVAQLQIKRQQQFKINLQIAMQNSKNFMKADYLKEKYHQLSQKVIQNRTRHHKRIQRLNQSCLHHQSKANKLLMENIMLRQFKEQVDQRYRQVNQSYQLQYPSFF